MNVTDVDIIRKTKGWPIMEKVVAGQARQSRRLSTVHGKAKGDNLVRMDIILNRINFPYLYRFFSPYRKNIQIWSTRLPSPVNKSHFKKIFSLVFFFFFFFTVNVKGHLC